MCSGRMIHRIGFAATRGWTLEDITYLRRDGRVLELARETRCMEASGMAGTCDDEDVATAGKPSVCSGAMRVLLWTMRRDLPEAHMTTATAPSSYFEA